MDISSLCGFDSRIDKTFATGQRHAKNILAASAHEDTNSRQILSTPDL
jgi:hypothetical protein